MQVLLGPRQAEKTTAAKGVFGARGVYASADSPTPLPASLIAEWWAQAQRCTDPILVIDEVQKIAGWSEEVKRLWDANDGVKLVVLGSSALLVERGLSETLAGRFEILRAEHWSLTEAQQSFGVSLAEFVEFGCYPGSMTLLTDRERWGAYVRDSIVEPTLGRDLLQLHPIDSPALLRELFGVAAAHPAEIISLQKIARQLQHKGAVQTVSNYLQLLSQAFIISTVQKFSTATLRTRQSSPKLIVHDNALIRAFERPIAATPPRERLGHYIENAVGARLIESGWKTFYWRERDLEVDFITISPANEKLAIEVKSTPPAASELRGLKTFCSRNDQFKPVVVCESPVNIPWIEWRPLSWALSLTGTNRV